MVEKLDFEPMGVMCAVFGRNGQSGTISLDVKGPIIDENYDDTAVHPVDKQLMERYPWCIGYAIEVQSKDNIIRESAFANCLHLVSVYLSGSIHTIEVGGFYGCTNLRTITLPEQLTNIQQEAFADCKCLECVNLPKALNEIDEDVFKGCDAVHTVSMYAHHLDAGLEFESLQRIRYVLVLSGDDEDDESSPRTRDNSVPLTKWFVNRTTLLEYTTTSLKDLLKCARCSVLQIKVINDE